MRFVIDALGAPGTSGGMRLYADGVLRGWLERHPEDRIFILGPKWVAEEFQGSPNIRVVGWPNDAALPRVLGQFVLSAMLFWATRSDVLISLSPVVSPLVRRNRRVCVVQDWRHIKNPQEFGRAQLIYRRLWRASVAGAGAVVTMSQKTQDETRQLVPGARSTMVDTGRDYVRYWPAPADATVPNERRVITTFGHHSNKRPELVLDALALLPAEQAAGLELVVLGARGSYGGSLMTRAAELGITELCTFPGFVEEQDYRALIQRSSLVVLASSDEGFGLPVAEANYLGIPALVTSDSGLASIHHQGIVVADPTAESVASAMEAALNGAVARADLQSLTTWGDTATGIRSVATDILPSR